jgi:hypothetical protein
MIAAKTMVADSKFCTGIAIDLFHQKPLTGGSI